MSDTRRRQSVRWRGRWTHIRWPWLRCMAHLLFEPRDWLACYPSRARCRVFGHRRVDRPGGRRVCRMAACQGRSDAEVRA